ncbi:hypothetical protein BCV70DRAFT_112291 [Testicularia cyperi]|uniref:Nucleoporin Nup54 alpha-helical domain-containing protein n=1 Tax=Testicularia cyperi TaxID=1882483 RepID=A0A317XPE5_9BASI|nr:hypothetical protein BCV70DRAFT_112291 [Testicularia cyperi]
MTDSTRRTRRSLRRVWLFGLVLIAVACSVLGGRNDESAQRSTPLPAGRALLYRPARFQTWDFPLEVAMDGWDSTVHMPKYESLKGPKGFWTDAGLRAHYELIKTMRYAPEFFPVPPPYEVWLKEQQMLMAIKMHEETIKMQLQTSAGAVRPQRGAEVWTKEKALQWEMTRAEQILWFHLLQMSIVRDYAQLDPEWMAHELKLWRAWASFLQHSAETEVQLFTKDQLKRYLNTVNNEIQRLSAIKQSARSKVGVGAAPGSSSSAARPPPPSPPPNTNEQIQKLIEDLEAVKVDLGSQITQLRNQATGLVGQVRPPHLRR